MANGGALPNSAFCLSRLRGKNPQKVGNLLPDIGGVVSQHPVGLRGQFRPPISIAKGERRRPTILGIGVITKPRHVNSPFSYPRKLCSMLVPKQNLPLNSGVKSIILGGIGEREVNLLQRMPVPASN